MTVRYVSRHRRVLASVAGLALVLAACGGDSDDGAADEPAAAEEPAAEPAAEPEAEAPAEG